jgi:hypothetical protein
LPAVALVVVALAEVVGLVVIEVLLPANHLAAGVLPKLRSV